MEYREHMVPRGPYQIYAKEYPGEGPAIVLMHGFPDNMHLYDRLVPHLSGRRVVLFDFLGWGGSDKPASYPYTADNQTRDLDAVIEHLGIEDVVVVAHDASGPPAIDWALWHPESTAALVLLNTYYGRTPAARPPEAIFLFSTPVLRNVARFVSGRFDLFRRMYGWQVGTRFIRDEEVRKQFVPLFYEQFAATPSTKPAFFSLIADLWDHEIPLGCGARDASFRASGEDNLWRGGPLSARRRGASLPPSVHRLRVVPLAHGEALPAAGRARGGGAPYTLDARGQEDELSHRNLDLDRIAYRSKRATYRRWG
jgi:haloalkane dehalogenase